MPARQKGHRAKTHSADKRVVRATYDAAQTTDNNKRRWQYTDGLSANEANSQAIRHTLIRRARYECSNNTYASGMVDTLAQDCIGTGSRLQMHGDEDVHKKIEAEWKSWCKATGWKKKQLVMRRTKAQDGEVLGMMVTRKKQNHPIKLYVQLFEAEQCQSHPSQSDEVDGVRLDEYGEPKEYRILEAHPGSLKGVNRKGKWVSADKIIHYAHTVRPGQIRGIPEITPALELFVQLRSYTLSVLAASELAANISALMYTDAGVNDEADEVDPMLSWEVERNTLKALPFGWKLAQLKAEQPTTSYPQFKGEIINEMGRGVHMPKNVAAGDSSGYNYASGRLDHTRYFKSIEVERALLDSQVNDPVFDAWLKEWAAFNAVDLSLIDTSHSWQYDAQEHVDPVKTATAQNMRITTGVSNLSIEASKEGRDWEDVLVQKLKEEKLELQLRQEMGLPVYSQKGDIIVNINEKNGEEDDET